MSDDSDLLIAAAATAAVFTWIGTRQRSGRARRTSWHAWGTRWRAVRRGIVRSWRETPIYLLFTAVRDAFFRKR